MKGNFELWIFTVWGLFILVGGLREPPKQQSPIYQMFNMLHNKTALSKAMASAGKQPPVSGRNFALPSKGRKTASVPRQLLVQMDAETPIPFMWTAIEQMVSLDLVQRLWLESNITETLDFTLQQRATIFKSYGPLTSLEDSGGDFTCPTSATELKLELSTFPVHIPGYKGEFGILSQKLTQELFYYIANVSQATPGVHTSFYFLRDYCVFTNLEFLDGNYQIASYFTKNFMYMVIMRYTQEAVDVPYALTWLLGKPAQLPVLKGALNYQDITVAKNKKYILAALATGDTTSHILNYLVPNYSDMFSHLVQSDPMDVITELQNRFLRLQAEGRCHIPLLTFEFLDLAFQTIGVHFLFSQGLQENMYTDVQCASKILCELNSLRSLFELCFPELYFRGFRFSTLAKVAATQIMNVPATSVSKMNFESQEAVLHLLQVSTPFAPATDKTLWVVAEIVMGVYSRYVNGFLLSSQDRKLLLECHFTIRNLKDSTRVVSNPNLMLVYVLTTSMCNTLEMAELIQKMTAVDQIYFNETFSPCYTSLRFDFNKDKLYSSAYQSSDLSAYDKQTGVSNLYNVLHEEHIDSLTQLPGIKCLDSNYSLILAIPLPNITYFMSKTQIPKAKNYAITQVYLNSHMYISAVLPNCSLLPGSDAVNPIPIVYNISNPKHECIFCESILLNYDEQGGFQSMMYVTSKSVQDQLFLSTSPFFDSTNLHSHYLLLSNNGTVVEIRGKYREQVLSLVIFILFIISFAAGTFAIYKFASYCC